MFIRTKLEFDDEYTPIPNAWLRDENLSLKAKGLLGQILTHSPGWKMTILSLAKANGCGRDAIRGAIKELVIQGYLERSETRERDVHGRLGDYTYTTVNPRKQVPDPTYVGKTYVGKPDLGEADPQDLRRVAYVGKTYVGKSDTKNIDNYIDINNLSKLEEYKSIPEPKGKRLPNEWQPNTELTEWAHKQRPDLNIEQVIDEFRDYWHAVPGARGIKLNWDATFRNWIRRTKQADTPKLSNTQENMALHARLFSNTNTESGKHHEPRANIRAIDRS